MSAVPDPSPLTPARTPPPSSMFPDPEQPPAPVYETSAAAIVQRLRAGFDAGHSRPIEWRREQLVRLRRLLVENQAALLDALRADLGKPEREALLTDLGPVLGEIDGALRSVRRWSRPRRVATPLMLQPGRSSVVCEPLGVVLIIAPWNYPVQLLLAPLVGALAAGNAAVLKPSEISVQTSQLLARLIPAYLDGDTVAVVQGGPQETEQLLA